MINIVHNEFTLIKVRKTEKYANVSENSFCIDKNHLKGKGENDLVLHIG